jgi:hypothetical protein
LLTAYALSPLWDGSLTPAGFLIGVGVLWVWMKGLFSE